MRDAAARGKISLVQAKAINAVLDGLPTSLDSTQRTKAQLLLLAAAEHAAPDTLRGMSEKVLAQVAPEEVETAEGRAERLAQRDARANARRCLRFGSASDGSIDITGSLPVVDARRLQHLVQTIADRSYRAAKDSRDRRALTTTPQQRLADALVTVVSAAEARDGRRHSESDSASIPGGAARINVVMSVDDLHDRASARGLLNDGTELSPGELRRLACGAELIPVVLGTDSTILDVGFAHRLAPWPVRHAVGLRDGGCAFPGCAAPLEHCDIHHITPWQQGGATSVPNLVALCRAHHSLVEPAPPMRHPDGLVERVDQWEVRIDGRGLPEFLPPAAMDPYRTPVRRVMSHVQELLDTG